MKIPATPPDAGPIYSNFINRLISAPESERADLANLLGRLGPTDETGRYLHWDKFRFRPTPEGLDAPTAWALTRYARMRLEKRLPLFDLYGRPFTFTPTDQIQKALHEIDSEAHGGIRFTSEAPQENDAKSFLVKSLIEEPFNSSLLEGAATTREEAKRLIREQRRPVSEGERMVMNNYHAIEFIKARRDDPLTPELIHELHRIITDKTLENPQKSGRFREHADDIKVVDEIVGTILHHPPPAAELPDRFERLCKFANANDTVEPFIHPIIRAIILHFMLAYDHPYIDGNGRTARALFYWSVLKDGYWLLEYVSISRIINKAPISYGKAFLETETDHSDITYFIVHQLEVITSAIDDLSDYVRRRQQSVLSLTQEIESSAHRDQLNHRQIDMLNDAIRNPNVRYTIREHERLHRISYLTARTDLEKLTDLGFLVKSKHGAQSIYKPAPRLRQKIPSVQKT
ncbi:MAG: Fic family protein [Parvularculaceae bacterium]|nr:Fic family protein [Parvularculaceae bacterium]